MLSAEGARQMLQKLRNDKIENELRSIDYAIISAIMELKSCISFDIIQPENLDLLKNLGYKCDCINGKFLVSWEENN